MFFAMGIGVLKHCLRGVCTTVQCNVGFNSFKDVCSHTGLNRGPSAHKTDALPTEL